LRKYTEAQKKSAKKWDAENLDRVSVALPKGMKADIKAAIGEGGSVNGFIREAVEAKLNGITPTPTAGNAPETPQEAAGAILEGGVVCLPSEEEKSAQNAPEVENGRTACSVKSDIYEAAAVAAGKKSVSINDFVDKWVKIGADETEKIIRLSGNMHKPLQIEKPNEAPYPAPKKKTEEPKPAYVWNEDGTPTTWAEIFEREGWNKPKNKSAGE
jgi:predicted HicB family RNase H-like nuclease